jgi:ferredoxin-NADP reductase/ferredoxin
VARVDRESVSVLSLTLAPADDFPLAAALPGQFIILRLHPKPSGPPLLRNYSLSGVPTPDHYRVSVKLEAGGAASTYIHNQVKVGDVLEVAAPRGSFTLKPGETQVVLLSAGVGATPVLAMLHSLAAERSAREVWWIFGARNAEDHPFAQESRNLVQSLPHARSFVEYSRPAPNDCPRLQFDAAGRITVAVLESSASHVTPTSICAGPLRSSGLTSGLAAWGVVNDHIRSEAFGPAKAITPGIADSPHPPPHPPAGPAASGPNVSFARSGIGVPWDPKFPSLLDFAEACDVPVRWSCRTGVCHMCESGLISGTVAYQPEPLDPPGQGNLLICCSRPQGDVVLDL